MNNKETKRLTWSTLAFMAFSIVWGFGNVINGFSEFGGLQGNSIMDNYIYNIFYSICINGWGTGLFI